MLSLNSKHVQHVNIYLACNFKVNLITHPGVEKYFGQAQAQGFLNFFNPSPVSDLPSPNL
jgi:hypothetical protein